MRDIKFRAWDKKEKKMIWKKEYFTLQSALKEDISFFGFVANKYYIMDFEFMQFTGLHDKNGKEIYDGDILQLDNEKRVYWQVVQDNRNDFPRGWTIKSTHPQYSHPEVSRLEIIGNTYENPELLEIK